MRLVRIWIMDHQKVDGVGLFSFTKPMWADKSPLWFGNIDIDGELVYLLELINLVERCREVDPFRIYFLC